MEGRHAAGSIGPGKVWEALLVSGGDPRLGATVRDKSSSWESGVIARIVIKPLEGAIGKSVEFADGEMLIVLHKNSWEGLMPVLKCGIENLGRFKAAQ